MKCEKCKKVVKKKKTIKKKTETVCQHQWVHKSYITKPAPLLYLLDEMIIGEIYTCLNCGERREVRI